MKLGFGFVFGYRLFEFGIGSHRQLRFGYGVKAHNAFRKTTYSVAIVKRKGNQKKKSILVIQPKPSMSWSQTQAQSTIQMQLSVPMLDVASRSYCSSPR